MYKKEYLILSLCSYLNIQEKEIGKSMYEIFENLSKTRIEKTNFKSLNFENKKDLQSFKEIIEKEDNIEKINTIFN